ncbi:MAG: radical SAM protein [Deferrisomatales bacterium]
MTTTYRWADHRVFPTGEGALLWGAELATLHALDPASREVLGRWRGCEPLSLDAAPPDDRETLEGFREARLLVPALARPAPAPGAVPDPAGAPLATLVLQVAQGCNLRCDYCYAEGGGYGGEPALMTPELARRAVRFLVERSGDRPEVTLVLFGGEPLLNLPAVEAAVAEAEALAGATGKGVHLSLTTNATRLTPAVAEYLCRHGVGVSVSLDGPPDLHDRNRPYADGSGSYADAVTGLGLLLTHSPRPVAARVTLLPSQWGRVEEVFDHLLGLGFGEVGIAPASPVRPDLLPSPEQEDVLCRGFEALVRRFEAALAEGRFLPFSNLLDLLARIHAGRVQGVPCGAGLGYLAVDAGGRLSLCHRLTGDESFAAGDLTRGPDPRGIRASLEALAAPRRDACSACWARALCAGGCHYENHLRERTLGQAPGGTCGFVRRWIETGIRAYARVTADADGRLLHLLGRRAAC